MMIILTECLLNIFRFMMPKTFSIGEVLAVLRQRLVLTREEGLVLFANEKYMIKPNAKLEEVYDKYKDQDGFLYLVYAEENIYGWMIEREMRTAIHWGEPSNKKS